jgi:allose kinase
MNGQPIIGVDVGGTNIRIGAVDATSKMHQSEIFASKLIQGPKAPEILLRYLKQYIDSLNVQVRAVSIGFPSTINRSRTMVINTPNLDGFNNVNICKLYETELTVPVLLEKDATMLLYYDIYANQIKNNGVVIGIYIGTGLGNSILVDGKPLVGHDGVACELGHIPVLGRNDICGCGLTGCLELYAGGKGLERMCREAFPETKIKEVFSQHADSPLIQKYICDIADAVVIELNLFNPDCIILGGGVLAMKDFPLQLLKKTILSKTRRPVPGDNLQLVISEAKNPFNGVVGASLYAQKELERRNETYASTCK